MESDVKTGGLEVIPAPDSEVVTGYWSVHGHYSDQCKNAYFLWCVISIVGYGRTATFCVTFLYSFICLV